MSINSIFAFRKTIDLTPEDNPIMLGREHAEEVYEVYDKILQLYKNFDKLDAKQELRNILNIEKEVVDEVRCNVSESHFTAKTQEEVL